MGTVVEKEYKRKIGAEIKSARRRVSSLVEQTVHVCACVDQILDEPLQQRIRAGHLVERIAGSAYFALTEKHKGVKVAQMMMDNNPDLEFWVHLFCGWGFVNGYDTLAKQEGLRKRAEDEVARLNAKLGVNARVVCASDEGSAPIEKDWDVFDLMRMLTLRKPGYYLGRKR